MTVRREGGEAVDNLSELGRGVGFHREVGAYPERGSRWAGDPVPALSSALFLSLFVLVPFCLLPQTSHLLLFPLLLCLVPPAQDY